MVSLGDWEHVYSEKRLGHLSTRIDEEWARDGLYSDFSHHFHCVLSRTKKKRLGSQRNG